MKKQTYEKMTGAFRDNPKRALSLHICNRILTAVVFVSYPALILWLMAQRSFMLYRSIAVPLLSFLIVSVFRYLVNRPRPYEVFEIPPVIEKTTKGKSFPSRHVFSAAIIAVTFLVQPEIGPTAAGAVLMLLTLLLGAIRVLSGVHFLSDVLAALAFAGIGLASYYIFV